MARNAGTPDLQNVWELPEGLDAAPPGLDDDARASVAEAHDVLDRELAAVAERTRPPASCCITGHAHLDLAWRWPLAETRRKAQRTLSTMAGMLERHPEFTLQPVDRAGVRLARGGRPRAARAARASPSTGASRPIGGMWVEPDCVMPTGESLARQLLYGQRYFQGRFGTEHTVCWLPDCFGFTPALPQLLVGAGIERFFTMKLSWSETNPFPHDLFVWEGLDGSRVLAHMFDNPDGGYNGVAGASAALGTWRNFKGKGVPPGEPALDRLRGRRRRADRGDGRARARHGRLPGAARAAVRARRRVLRPHPGRRPAGVDRASCTWSCTAGR